ncbi:amidohydrolase [Brevibacterium album]|uniref:amidohydrolase n=1 Tax=Brevibacterium album TaxID=417948 RepID=UPI0003F91680|nr:amidohydrolase [Brevibacterium album]
MMLDLILDNARIRTFDEDRPAARTMGVWNGRIVGFDEDVRGLNAKRRLNLGDAAVLPGFNDVHCHTAWYGLTLASVDCTALPGGLPEVYAKLEAASAAVPSGEWINATGYGHRDYGGEYPDLAVLDRITGDRPLFLRQQSGHAAIVNTAAMRLAGILEPGFQDPPGGHVVRDQDGRPTGLVEETAQALVQDLIRPYSLETLVGALDLATAQYAREGITSFGECGVFAGWIGHSPIEVHAYQLAREQGLLRARAQLMPMADGLHAITAHSTDGYGIGLDTGVRTGFGDERLSFGPVKIFMDGAMSGETAAMRENYAGTDTAGYLQDDPEVLRRLTLEAYRSGWSVAVHAIGDLAVDHAVANIVEAIDTYGQRTLPNRIEHAAMVHDEHLPTLARYGIAVTPQAAFARDIGDGMNRSLGEDRRRLLYRGRSFVDAGIMLPGSSDRPCADGTALRGIQAFVDRATGGGDVMGSAAECLTAEQAVAAYTKTAAEASGHSSFKGTLTAGKVADLVVLADDPVTADPARIGDIDVLATAVGGEFTHWAL